MRADSSWATTTARAAAVEVGAGIHAGRPLLHGRVRRFLPQSLLADLRVHAARPEAAGESRRAARRPRLAQAAAGLAAFRADRTRRVRPAANSRADGYSLSTNQPPYQPSRVPPAPGGDPRYADPSKHILPPQTQKTIGDTLSAQGHFVGVVFGCVERGGQGRHAAAAAQADDHRQQRASARRTSSRITSRSTISRASRPAPRTVRCISRTTRTSSRRIDSGDLPAVAFYKPQGTLQRASGLHRRDVGRPAHRGAPDAHQGESAVELDGGHRHLRRERRFLGSRAAAAGRPLGSGHSHSGDHRVAVREEGLRRSHDATTRRRSSNSSRCGSALEPLPGVRARRPANLTAAFDFGSK